MATQGLLTLVRDNKVLAKVVAGCDGDLVVELAYKVRTTSCTTARELFKAAKELRLGGSSSLVVIAKENGAFVIEDNADMGKKDAERYMDTFDKPRWNPRWDYGTADYVEVVEV